MFERFTERSRRVMVLAQEEARLCNHNFIGTEHLLLGLIHEGEGVAAKVLTELGISLEAVRERVPAIEEVDPEFLLSRQSPPFTPRAKKTLELALREALQLGHNYIGTEHILLGIVREGEGQAARILFELGGELSKYRQKVIELLASYKPPFPPPPPPPNISEQLLKKVLKALVTEQIPMSLLIELDKSEIILLTSILAELNESS